MSTVVASLSQLVVAFLDAEQLPATRLRTFLASWPAEGRVPCSAWMHCLQWLSEEAGAQALGPRLVRHLQPHHMGVLGSLCACYQTMGEALLCLQHYHRLVYDGNEQCVSLHGADVILRWNMERFDYSRLSCEVAASLFARMAMLLAGERWCFKEVCWGTGDAIADFAPYEEFFGCRVQGSIGLPSMRFSMDCLLLPVLDPQLQQRESLQCEADRQLQALGKDDFAYRLNDVLRSALSEGQCTVVNIAERLHLSVRSLQRRLAERGVTFAGLLDYTRAELARDHVRNRSIPLGSIAGLLGFSEQSAFNRAFRRWYGMTPQELRMRSQ